MCAQECECLWRSEVDSPLTGQFLGEQVSGTRLRQSCLPRGSLGEQCLTAPSLPTDATETKPQGKITASSRTMSGDYKLPTH